MENCHLLIFPLKIVIFHSYVKLPEGTILALGRLSRKKNQPISTIHVCPQPLATSIGKSSTKMGDFSAVLQNHRDTAATCGDWVLMVYCHFLLISPLLIG
jgi:hypothetical protein